MKLHFHGADREVTGSRHLLEVNGKKILLDCGMFQGRRNEEREKNKNFGFKAEEVDAVILSHAHIDHSGNLPNLVKQGFNGPIYCTKPTVDLMAYMLRDSAFIQEREVEYLNEKKQASGETLIEPIYTSEDVEKTLPMAKGVDYDTCMNLFGDPDIMLCFREAGHILGSAITILTIKDHDDGKVKRLVFTGDLGRRNMPLIRNPYQVEEAEIMIMESTYGNRLHESILEAEGKLAEIVKNTAARGGKILIPAFSLGRTQEIVYELHKLVDEGKIPLLPIYVDSPLSVNLTEVFRNNLGVLDEETQKLFLNDKDDPFNFAQLHYIQSVEESKALNEHNGPCIIISSSGMCEHGRILHHLKNSIEDHRNTLIIVGFQAQNTLGRKLIEKMNPVNIFGKPYAVKMEIKIMNAYSAHADRSDLLDYATKVGGLQKLILVHGEDQACEDLKTAMLQNGIKEVLVPSLGESVEL
ncbi:MAG: MBL fold metallo-hydrolase [Candidatus Gracilibacteria bacterium]|jgi:metallo-beta-lactamase family protein